jgi:transposase-like protein
MPLQNRLTDQVQALITEALRRGATVRVAAAAAGISRHTLYLWLRQGRRLKSGRMVNFFNACRVAQAQALATCAAKIMEAVHAGDVRAAMWFLERRAPEAYGPCPVKEIDRRLKALERADEVNRGLAGTAARGLR